MSIQRFIYPRIWRSRDIAALSIPARLLYIGIISTADDHGRRRADPELLRGDIFPFDNLTLDEVAALLNEIQTLGLVRVYAGGEVLDIPSWSKYQRPKYKKPSDLPQFVPDSGTNQGQGRDKPARKRPQGLGMGMGKGVGQGIPSASESDSEIPKPPLCTEEPPAASGEAGASAGQISEPEQTTPTDWPSWVSFLSARQDEIAGNSADLAHDLAAATGQDLMRCWAFVCQARGRKSPVGYLASVLMGAKHSPSDEAQAQAKRESVSWDGGLSADGETSTSCERPDPTTLTMSIRKTEGAT